MKHPFVRDLLALLSFVLLGLLAACGSGATTTAEAIPTVASTEEPAAPTTAPTAEPEVEPVPTVEPAPTAVSAVDPAMFERSTVAAINTTATRAWVATVGTTDQIPCNNEPGERLATIDLATANGHDVVATNAGYITDMSIESILFRDDASAVISLFCLEGENTWLHWLQSVDFAADGTVEEIGPLHPIDADWIFDIQWLSAEELTFGLYRDEPSGTENPTRVVFNLATGASVPDTLPNRPVGTSPAGDFTYFAVDAPDGTLGCEAVDYALVLEVQDANGARPAILGDSDTFNYVADFAVHPNGLAAWTDTCEGYPAWFMGRTATDGSLIDVHFIDWSIQAPIGFQPLAARLTGDGALIGVGTDWNEDAATQRLAVHRWQSALDPDFVNTGPNQPTIDTSAALFASMDGTTQWFTGTNTVADPGCGGTTLYASSPDGFRRLFPAGLPEPGGVVDVDAAEVIEFESIYDSPAQSSRPLVFSTICPEAYEGRKLWIGSEGSWGGTIYVTEVISIDPVAEVLSLAFARNSDTGIGEYTVEARQLDGSTDSLTFTQ